jgi:hypothetical protein
MLREEAGIPGEAETQLKMLRAMRVRIRLLERLRLILPKQGSFLVPTERSEVQQ